MAKLHIMVTNAGRRKAIPIIRALGRAGMKVTCADSIALATGFFSRYSNRRLLHPDPCSERFMDALLEWLSRNPCDAIFPLDDDVLEVLSRSRDLLPRPAALLLPEHEQLALAGDKSLLIPYAQDLGIPVPQTLVITDEHDMEKLDEIPLPAIVKPSHSSGSRGLVYVNDRSELRRACLTALSKGEAVLVQDRLPPEGEGLGYFALYDRDNRLVAEFMHARLREYPLSGGPSTLREGIWDEDIARHARRLLDSLRWAGPAMVEFKRDMRDGVPRLMEINPRFWGSIALPIFSGVNFPVLAAKLAAGHPVQPAPKGAVGKRARWLWPGDILQLAGSLRKRRWPKGFLDFFDRNTCYDILSLTDPLPALALIASTLMDRLSVRIAARSPLARKRQSPRVEIIGKTPRPGTEGIRRSEPSACSPSVMTIDVEDWFHILDSDSVPPIQQWDKLPPRLEQNVERILEIFEQSGTRATFFWLGWCAERNKDLVRRCLQAGHEIASHGYSHVLAYEAGRERFTRDVIRAKELLEDITGQDVPDFRAAGFGITHRTPWAFEVIREAGHVYDSSAFPRSRGHGGLPGAPVRPHIIETPAGKLVECPVSLVEIVGHRIPLFGGGYLRAAPASLIRWGIERLRNDSRPLITYLHPREIDPHHPRLPLPLTRRFKSYVNLRTTEPKLRWLVSEYRFRPMRELAERSLNSPERTRTPAIAAA